MSKFTPAESLDWSPFKIGTSLKPRPLNSIEGIVDRIRIAAFAERQAYYAFLEAARIFADEVPEDLVKAWKRIAMEEAKHESWLLKRLVEINQNVAELPVGLGLYNSFGKCETAREFTFYISDSEEKGRLAGLKFVEALKTRDPKSAKIFSDIAFEELDHISLASKYF
ncbi:MAG: ferritin-like domain-containing protein [Bacteriovorax sp.]|nr:ferritin-like domain-containing protein [Bacteriovorax sp.]